MAYIEGYIIVNFYPDNQYSGGHLVLTGIHIYMVNNI